MTVDGFPIVNTFSFLPDKPDPDINQWSYGKVTKIPVSDFWFNMRWVTWKGKKMYVEYDLLIGMVRDWMRGCTEAESKIPMFAKHKTMTKEEALDFAFEI